MKMTLTLHRVIIFSELIFITERSLQYHRLRRRRFAILYTN